MMDVTFNPEDVTLPQIALYATISFLIVTVLGVLLYITCSKKYRLNWFERNLLETACENQEFGQRYDLVRFNIILSHTKCKPFDLYCSQEALLIAGGSIPYNIDTVDSNSLRSSNRSPVSVSETFWVPSGHRQSATYGEAIASTSAGFRFT